MTNIREVQKSDNASLAKLIRNVFEEHDAPKQGTVYSDPTTDHLYALFQAENSVLWIAEKHNEVLGSCGIYPTKGLPNKCTELVKFYLSPKARGQGIGKALMKKSIQSAIKMNYSDIYLESLPHFSNAVHMYLKQGFLKLDAPMGHSGHDACNIWMIKRLKNLT